MSDETGASVPAQVQCHKWIPCPGMDRWLVEYEVAGHSLSLFVDRGYCPTCGIHLGQEGDATPQIPWARAQQAERMLEKALLEAVHLSGLLAVLDEALEYGDIAGSMYGERTLEGEKIGDDTPMWMGPMKRNGACMSAKKLAEELLRDGFRAKRDVTP